MLEKGKLASFQFSEVKKLQKDRKPNKDSPKKKSSRLKVIENFMSYQKKSKILTLKSNQDRYLLELEYIYQILNL